MIAYKNIIKLKNDYIKKLTILHGSDMTLSNMVFVLKYDIKYIFIGHLKETRILYHDYFKNIVLKMAKNFIDIVLKENKLFILELQYNIDMIIIT